MLAIGCLALTGLCCRGSTDPDNGVRERWFKAQVGTGGARPSVIGEFVLFGTGDNKIVARGRRTGAELWSTGVTSISVTRGVEGANFAIAGNVAAVPLVLNTVAVDVGTGQELWSYSAPLDTVNDPDPRPGVVSHTRIAADASTIYIGAWGPSVTAVDALSGQVRWVWGVDPVQFPNRAGAWGVAISGDTVFATVWYSVDGRGLIADAWLVALDRNTGGELWRFTVRAPTGGAVVTGAPVVYRNLVIFSINGGDVYAVDRATTQLAWRFVAEPFLGTSAGPALYGDVIYQDGGDEHIYALRAGDGGVIWKAAFEAQTSRDLLVTAKRVYASNGTNLHIFDRATGRRVARLGHPKGPINGVFGSAPAYADGQVFVTVFNGAWSFDEP